MPLNIYRRETHTIKAPEKLLSCEALLRKEVATGKRNIWHGSKMLPLLLPRLVKNNDNAPPPNFLPSTHQYILFTHVEAM
ncbi:MAG: hypothetical protein F6K54_07440 [Okeania sp. SIO3B5]|uniref:hypothetical protein n=1 Tax=Okeania sp. SIO3B5 TaxID=2607811 RepID=UPI0013FF76EC|nr:hypothetical protein [Okeania sp. SIO3B5]NEO52926.1 hypothetical protein [Okeania sp. SIO3B5]